MAEDHWLTLARNALDKGGRIVRPSVLEWDASGRCENPIPRSIKGLSTDYLGKVNPRGDNTPTRYLDLWVPCRKCTTCLKRKAQHWTHRASSEIALWAAAGGRSWRVTLTFRPEFRARLTWAARRAVGEKEWPELSQEQRSNTLAKQASSYVTRFMKRLREKAGPGLRYMSVIERHEDGTPHVHLLVHESGGRPIRHRQITSCWQERLTASGPAVAIGFTNVKLVDDVQYAARYAAKYISKSPVTRVRASVGYGQNPGATTA